MRVDNKTIVYTGRNEGEIEPIFTYDESNRKAVNGWGGSDLPRDDEDDGNQIARLPFDDDYTSRRHDSWLERREPHLDNENNTVDEPYHIVNARDQEQPDAYALEEDWIDGEEV